jgi:hypothetical protein
MHDLPRAVTSPSCDVCTHGRVGESFRVQCSCVAREQADQLPAHRVLHRKAAKTNLTRLSPSQSRTNGTPAPH